MIRFEKEREARLRRAYAVTAAPAAEKGPRVVRFSDELRVPVVIDDNDGDEEEGEKEEEGYEGMRCGSSSGEMHLILNSDGEVVGRRESLPDLRTVRGRSVSRSPTT
ncbi:hypothetical protein LX36DRAFT_657186 [Colletotrichum falcatum]|nr:hypothetical protein LX36DRAFT_657186 [Colletotrichum falcatum]